MTQQTIGNTVYHVGQEIFCNSPEKYKELQELAEQGITLNQIAGGITGMIFKITALPNPDPVTEEWREVCLDAWNLPVDQHGRLNIDVFYGLRHAMQEVCKADEVKLEWTENTWPWKYKSSYRRFEITDVQEAMQTITLCFLLGGRVFVKGGV